MLMVRRLTHIVAHVIVGGPNHVSCVAFLKQLAYGTGAEKRDVIGMRLNRGQDFALEGET